MAQVQAMLAEAREKGKAEGIQEMKDAKAEAREARKEALAKKGWTMFKHTPEREERNILADGVYVVPGKDGKPGFVIEGSACMVDHQGVKKPRYRLAVNPIWGTNGDTDTDADRLVEACVVKAENAREILDALSKAYFERAGLHSFRVKPKKGKASAE